jgi:hypothetical protein
MRPLVDSVPRLFSNLREAEPRGLGLAPEKDLNYYSSTEIGLKRRREEFPNPIIVFSGRRFLLPTFFSGGHGWAVCPPFSRAPFKYAHRDGWSIVLH